jgi:hypothetical protein
MSESREFSTASILSLATGISFCNFGEIHEATEYLMGHPVWTHHFASKELWDNMRQAVIDQYPMMPTEIKGVTKNNYLEKLAEIEAKIGKTIIIRKGDGLTVTLPEDGIPDHLKDKIIHVHI